MDFKSHFIVAVGCFVALWLLFPDKISLPLILIPIWMNQNADSDFKFKSHRNILSHSIVIPLIVYFFLPITFVALIAFSLGLHCSCDLSFKVKGGGYTIKWFGNKSIGGFRFANAWLGVNFLISLIVLYYQLVIVM